MRCWTAAASHPPYRVLAVWLAGCVWSFEVVFFGRAGFFGLCAALRESAVVDFRLGVSSTLCVRARDGIAVGDDGDGAAGAEGLGMPVTGRIAAVCEMFVFQLVHRTLQLPLCRRIAGRALAVFLPPPIPSLGGFMGPMRPKPCAAVRLCVRPSACNKCRRRLLLTVTDCQAGALISPAQRSCGLDIRVVWCSVSGNNNSHVLGSKMQKPTDTAVFVQATAHEVRRSAARQPESCAQLEM